MSRPSLHTMLDALQHLGVLDEHNEEDQPIQPQELRYDGTHPGNFVGQTEEKTYRRGDRFGQGEMKYDSGDVYNGEWSKDHMNGNGTFSKSTKEAGWLWDFVGTFKNDCPFSGKLRQRTQKRYSEGTWKHGIEIIDSNHWEYRTVFDQKPRQKK